MHNAHRLRDSWYSNSLNILLFTRFFSPDFVVYIYTPPITTINFHKQQIAKGTLFPLFVLFSHLFLSSFKLIWQKQWNQIRRLDVSLMFCWIAVKILRWSVIRGYSNLELKWQSNHFIVGTVERERKIGAGN